MIGKKITFIVKGKEEENGIILDKFLDQYLVETEKGIIAIQVTCVTSVEKNTEE